MEYRRLGKAGLKISVLSLGSWVTFGKQVELDKAERMMTTAYDAGVNFFDNAEAYEAGESERIMGEVLKRLGWRRDSYLVSSKVFFGAGAYGPNQTGLSRKHIIEACHAALKRLQVDYLDLYFCHRPDTETPLEETVRAMDILVRQGKVLYWGTSEWTAARIAAAARIALQINAPLPTMEQPQYNLFVRDRLERQYAPLYRSVGLGTTIFSPLASGVLTGKYNDGIPDDSRLALPGYEWLRDMMLSEDGRRRLEGVKKLGAIAEQLGCSMAQLAIAWCVKNPRVSTVILGASRDEQLRENLASLDVVPKLTGPVTRQIESALR